MRPHRHHASAAGESSKDIEADPDAEKPARSHLEDTDEVKQPQKHAHLRVRKAQPVGTEGSRHSTGCADGRDDGIWREGGMSKSGGQSTEQIEDQISDMSQSSLDVVTKDPQEPHVSEEMQQAGVKEHRKK